MEQTQLLTFDLQHHPLQVGRLNYSLMERLSSSNEVIRLFAIFIALSIVSPLLFWVISGIGTAVYQPKKKQELLQREQAFAKTSDVLSTLSKPLSGKEVKEYQVLMTNVVMSPSWIQILVGGILSLFGGEINVFTKVVDWSRREAQQRLREQAAAGGYDEVVNVRMETTTLSKIRGGKDKTTGIEVLAYGTGIKY
ncbi:MAG: heavy metal-binding domain-containing protein [Euryarchaeota archaeon]|nr:heavy metal-binding domain-containing protein [Euryarchaeota archaeon]